MAKIEIQDLQKVFRTEHVETIALNGVSLTVNDHGTVRLWQVNLIKYHGIARQSHLGTLPAERY